MFHNISIFCYHQHLFQTRTNQAQSKETSKYSFLIEYSGFIGGHYFLFYNRISFVYHQGKLVQVTGVSSSLIIIPTPVEGQLYLNNLQHLHLPTKPPPHTRTPAKKPSFDHEIIVATTGGYAS